MECWRKSDCCWDEVNLATLACWQYYQISNIGVSLRREDVHILRKASEIEVEGIGKKVRLTKTLMRQFEEGRGMVGLRKEEEWSV